MKKIVITTTTFGEYDKRPLDICKENGYEVKLNPYKKKLTCGELVDFAKDAVGLIAGIEPITQEVLENLKALKVISRCGVGLDNVDLNAAGKLGIKVFNTPDAPTLAVAELTVALILNLLRKISPMDSGVKEGKWEKMMGNLLTGKRVGIIGFGRIGQRVAGILLAFDCDIVYSDPQIDSGASGFKKLPLRELLLFSDIITLHVGGNKTILGKEEFELIKKGAWLVNTSRGEVVDEEVLFSYLKDNKLAGAAIDVFVQEPYKGELRSLENVVLTPHVGSYAKEARVIMETQAVENLLKGLEG